MVRESCRDYKFGLIRDELSSMQVVGGLVGKLRT